MSLKLEKWDRDTLRRQGGLLLGGRHRLEIAVLIAGARSEDLYAAQIAGAVELGRKETGREIDRFREAGLLETAPEVGGTRSRPRGRPPERLLRRSEPTWEALVNLAESLQRGKG